MHTGEGASGAEMENTMACPAPAYAAAMNMFRTMITLALATFVFAPAALAAPAKTVPACTNAHASEQVALSNKHCQAAPATVLAQIGSAAITGLDTPAAKTVRVTGTGLLSLGYIEVGSAGLVAGTLVNPAGSLAWVLPYQAPGYTVTWTDTSIVVYNPNGFTYNSIDSMYNVQSSIGDYLWNGGTWGSNWLNLVPIFTV